MGISIMGSCRISCYAIPNSNPNPKNFKIQWTLSINEYLLVCVDYPDAKNFEGQKLLLYKNVPSLEHLLQLTNNELDPHFDDDTNKVSPIARFKPTQDGIDHAFFLAYNILPKDK